MVSESAAGYDSTEVRVSRPAMDVNGCSLKDSR